MSSVLLAIALLTTFGAIVLGAVTIESAVAERRRGVRLLETQVGTISNVREQDLSGSFSDRVVGPAGMKLRRLGVRLTPVELRRRIEEKLTKAGNPAGWDAERVVVAKLVGALGGAGFALIFGRLMSLSSVASISGIVVLGLIGWVAPGAHIAQRVTKRQDEIRRSLPDTMDLLTISVEAGLGFDAALNQVVQVVPGALSQEIGRMLHEMQLGVSRVDAFRHLADRTEVPELKTFVLSVIQADQLGVSVGKVLRAQAKELRTKRRQRAERKAMQIPVKLLFPLIFFVLPALFVVVVGPGAIHIMHSFFGA
jgi:tight adherence protein C